MFMVVLHNAGTSAVREPVESVTRDVECLEGVPDLAPVGLPEAVTEDGLRLLDRGNGEVFAWCIILVEKPRRRLALSFLRENGRRDFGWLATSLEGFCW